MNSVLDLLGLDANNPLLVVGLLFVVCVAGFLVYWFWLRGGDDD